MTVLKISKELSLPVDVAGEAIAILAKRGAGKTNTAIVLVEELHRANVQTVILDPVGVWWGIRSGQNGTKDDGLPMPVLGGSHGDVPLEPTAGDLVADVVVDTGQSVVVDVSEMSKTQQRSFVAEFAQRLYRQKAKSRSLLHVVLEEADEFAPQRVSNRDAPMVGAISQLIRRGRSRGIGMTVITQRSASLNKDVLDQADVLIAMRTTGPRDRKAIEGWIDHQDAEGVELVLPSLPNLATGEAWVWNPERGLLERTKVRTRRTFDTSATPGAGGKRAEPRSVAPIDLAALGKRIEETAEKAKQNDPVELRRRIRKLETDLQHANTVTETERIVEVEKIVNVEVPVLTDEDRELLRRAVDAANKAVEAFRFLAPTVEKIGDAAVQLAPGLELDFVPPKTEAPVVARVKGKIEKVAYSQKRPAQIKPVDRPAYPDMSASRAETNGDVTPAKQRILDALRWFEIVGIDAPTKQALAPMAGTRHTSGGFKNNLGNLRSGGYIDYPQANLVQLTDQGRQVAIEPPVEPTNESLQFAFKEVVPPAQRRILDVLIAAAPGQLARDDLADAVGVPATSGGFKNNLGKLRTMGAIEYPSSGFVKASELLFPEGT